MRRRVALAELERATRARCSTVLADRRLLTVSDGTVEVAHEALLREWPRLRGWLEEDAEGRRLHRHLREAAREWDAGGRDAGELYRGARLARALDWAAGHEPELNAIERAFLDDGRTRERRVRQRRLRLVLAGVASLLVLAVIAGVVALDQRGEARAEATRRRRSGSAPGRCSERTSTARCCSRARASRSTTRCDTRGNLLAALLASGGLAVLRGDGDGMTSV